jgi:hypothetical protein
MSPRSSRVIEILRETIRHAEQTPELGPYDPGVIELRRLLTRWVAEREAVTGTQTGSMSVTEFVREAESISEAQMSHPKNLPIDSMDQRIGTEPTRREDM